MIKKRTFIRKETGYFIGKFPLISWSWLVVEISKTKKQKQGDDER